MKHADESLAIAALFDCWHPKWRTACGLTGFQGNIRQALRAFGMEHLEGTPFLLDRMTTDDALRETVLTAQFEEAAILLTPRQLYSPGFLHVFRRAVPAHMILAIKSTLWWAVWDRTSPIDPHFHISTAEYSPRAR